MPDPKQLQLSQRDICTKFITPALEDAGWDISTQVLEEVSFTDGKIIVKGKLVARSKRKRADYILYMLDQFSERTNQLGQPKLAIIRIQRSLLPLPTFSEQQCITAKVQQLLQSVLQKAFEQEAKVAEMEGKRLNDNG